MHSSMLAHQLQTPIRSSTNLSSQGSLHRAPKLLRSARYFFFCETQSPIKPRHRQDLESLESYIMRLNRVWCDYIDAHSQLAGLGKA